MKNEKDECLNSKHSRSSAINVDVNDVFQKDTHPAGYCHDKEIGIDRSSWMIHLKDERYMSGLSLPGTHDTMSFYGGDIVACQTASLKTQLESGIRVLDIRCCEENGKFVIYHGPVYQKATFDKVLDTINMFLLYHPAETVYMRIQQEHSSSDSFEETFRTKYFEPRKNLFWNPMESSTPQDPPLRETRGRIVVLQKFGKKYQFGVKWNTLNVQDKYNLKTNWDLYDKWLAVKKHFDDANKSDRLSKETYVNFLSGSGGSFPYFVASGQSRPATDGERLSTGLVALFHKYPDFPRVNGSIVFEGTNILSAARIGEGKMFDKYVGMVMADFPGKELIDAIISLNGEDF